MPHAGAVEVAVGDGLADVVGADWGGYCRIQFERACSEVYRVLSWSSSPGGAVEATVGDELFGWASCCFAVADGGGRFAVGHTGRISICKSIRPGIM